LVEPEKVRDYLLSPTHPVGRFKAAYFAQLGFTQANWEIFASELRRIAAESDVLLGKFSRFSNKFEIPASSSRIGYDDQVDDGVRVVDFQSRMLCFSATAEGVAPCST
jgi:hypothetical protein